MGRTTGEEGEEEEGGSAAKKRRRGEEEEVGIERRRASRGRRGRDMVVEKWWSRKVGWMWLGGRREGEGAEDEAQCSGLDLPFFSALNRQLLLPFPSPAPLLCVRPSSFAQRPILSRLDSLAS